METSEAKRMVDDLESLSKAIREEVDKGERVDWRRVNEYMSLRERTIRKMEKLRLMPPNEQKRIRRLLEEDAKTIREIEEMKDKVAAQMRVMGNQGAGKVLDTKG